MTERAWRSVRHQRRSARVGLAVGVALVATSVLVLGQSAVPGGGAGLLRPTRHDPVPAQATAYWLTPAPASALTPALRDFARAALLVDGGDASSAGVLLAAPALDASPLGNHVRYYRGLVALRQGRLNEAGTHFVAIAASPERSYVVEQSLVRLAEVHEQRGQYALAAEAYARVLKSGPADEARLTHRFGVALERAGDVTGSIAAHRRVYYDFPLSPDADESGDVLSRLAAQSPPLENAAAKEQARAAALYAARRWAPAREAYVHVSATVSSGPDREQATVRMAAVDVQLKQYRSAVDRLRPLAAAGAHQAEAHLHLATALRGLGDADAYVQGVRTLATAHPQSPYAEEALNGLATFYVLRDEDQSAADVFAQMVRQFPAGRFAERAAWKAGWWAYRHGDMAGAVSHFETGAANFPRSDFRPPWLYWSARAKDQLGDSAGATARLLLTATDYHNSYYGRLARARLGEGRVVPPSVTESPATKAVPLPTERQIGLLLSLGLHDLALSETQFARRAWGDSPALMGTAALAQYRAGRLRPGINAMKRAYPQYLAAGGESLPADVLRVLFPLDYWPLLESLAKAQGIDPYVIAALAAQESTFDAGIKSSAGAIGLMQIMPATGRGFARRMGITPFSTARLTEPQINASIGTKYFADLMRQFGGAAYALAGYNAGEHRVVRWRAERPGLPVDEWIDDIPFPETQNYVKRILGTAEDYRRLYGGGVLVPGGVPAPAAGAAPSAKPAPKVTRPAPARAPARKTPAPKTPARRRPGADR